MHGCEKVSSTPVSRTRISASQARKAVCVDAEAAGCCSSIGWTTTQCSGRNSDLGAVERAARGSGAPGPPASPRSRLTLTVAETSLSWLLRSLARRNISARPPRNGATTAERLKTSCAVGPREAREEQAGRQREAHQADERLDRHQQVDQHAVRGHPAVADRRERLHAEEERVLEALERRAGVPAVERVRAAQEVEQGEQQVRGEVAGRDQREEARPGDREQGVVERERAEERQPLAHDVEAAVAVEQPALALLRDAVPKPKSPRTSSARLCGRSAPAGSVLPGSATALTAYRSSSAFQSGGCGVGSLESAFSIANAAIFSTAHGKCASFRLR